MNFADVPLRIFEVARQGNFVPDESTDLESVMGRVLIVIRVSAKADPQNAIKYLEWILLVGIDESCGTLDRFELHETS